MASGGRAPRSRTTRVAASRCSAGSTASRYGRPPPSDVAVEARNTVIAVKSGWLTLVGGIGARPLLTRTAARGQERRECSLRTLRHRWGASYAGPFFDPGAGLRRRAATRDLLPFRDGLEGGRVPGEPEPERIGLRVSWRPHHRARVDPKQE